MRLAQLGADVTIACRNPEKAFAALEDIKAQAPGAKVGCSFVSWFFAFVLCFWSCLPLSLFYPTIAVRTYLVSGQELALKILGMTEGVLSRSVVLFISVFLASTHSFSTHWCADTLFLLQQSVCQGCLLLFHGFLFVFFLLFFIFLVNLSLSVSLYMFLFYLYIHLVTYIPTSLFMQLFLRPLAFPFAPPHHVHDRWWQCR